MHCFELVSVKNFPYLLLVYKDLQRLKPHLPGGNARRHVIIPKDAIMSTLKAGRSFPTPRYKLVLLLVVAVIRIDASEPQ